MNHHHHQAPHSGDGLHPEPRPDQVSPGPDGTTTAVLEVTGVHWATSKNVVESVLSRRPGVWTVPGLVDSWVSRDSFLN